MNNRIKQIRSETKLTQAQFAERLNLSRNFVAMIEIGQRDPSDRTISDICREFGVDRIWLETGSGEPFKVIDHDDLITAALSHAITSDDTAKDKLLRMFATLSDDVCEAALCIFNHS